MLADTWPQIVFGACVTVAIAIVSVIAARSASRKKNEREDARRWQEPLQSASEVFLKSVQRYRVGAEAGPEPNGDAMDEAWLSLQQIAPMDVAQSAHELVAAARGIAHGTDEMDTRLGRFRAARTRYVDALRAALEVPSLGDKFRGTPDPRRKR